MLIPRLNSEFFTWLNWRAGQIKDLGVFCRYADITSVRGISILRRYAIGYCFGEELLCRPKSNQIALMCFKDNEEFWFHLRLAEFNKVFIL